MPIPGYLCGSISIHAPRMGSDILFIPPLESRIDFNPRSPHGERPKVQIRENNQLAFQSTPPAWGATDIRGEDVSPFTISIHAPRMGSDELFKKGKARIYYFNPRSPHGERRTDTRRRGSSAHISIHAPRMGSDSRKPGIAHDWITFQSTPPAWGATGRPASQKLTSTISIHAPRMGSDRAHFIST